MRRKKSSYYQVGLGKQFLNRASLIFIILLILTIGSFGGAIYADLKTGYLKKNVVEPVQKYLSEVGKAFETEKQPDSLSYPVNFNTTPSPTPSPARQPLKPTLAYYNPPTPAPLPTLSPSKSYDQLLKEQEEWSLKKQAENQKWFEEQNKINEQSSKDWFNQKVQENLNQLEEWKKQNGF